MWKIGGGRDGTDCQKRIVEVGWWVNEGLLPYAVCVVCVLNYPL